MKLLTAHQKELLDSVLRDAFVPETVASNFQEVVELYNSINGNYRNITILVERPRVPVRSINVSVRIAYPTKRGGSSTTKALAIYYRSNKTDSGPFDKAYELCKSLARYIKERLPDGVRVVYRFMV